MLSIHKVFSVVLTKYTMILTFLYVLALMTPRMLYAQVALIDSSGYLPLQSGNSWTYQFKYPNSTLLNGPPFVRKVVAAVEIDGVNCMKLQEIHSGEPGRSKYITIANDGIWELKKSENILPSNGNKFRRYGLLIGAVELGAKKSWNWVNNGKNYCADYSVNQELVKVPAGEFAALVCRRIVTEDQITIDETTMWYGKNVGKLKEYSVYSLGGGRKGIYQEELQSFQIAGSDVLGQKTSGPNDVMINDSRNFILKEIDDLEAKLPEAQKKDAENARYNEERYQNARKKISDLDRQAIEYLRNNEKLKAAATEAMSLAAEAVLADGSYKRSTGEADKLQSQIKMLKLRLINLGQAK